MHKEEFRLQRGISPIAKGKRDVLVHHPGGESTRLSIKPAHSIYKALYEKCVEEQTIPKPIIDWEWVPKQSLQTADKYGSRAPTS